MQCPVCGDNLREIERRGIQIDICPGCKGVWLDRGELEKLLALEHADEHGAAPDPRRYDDRRRRDDDDDDDDDRYPRPDAGHRGYQEGSSHHPYHRRKKGWLSDIMDVFGD